MHHEPGLSLALSSSSLVLSSRPVLFNPPVVFEVAAFGGREGCIRDKRSSELSDGTASSFERGGEEDKRQRAADAGCRRRAPGEGNPRYV